METIKLNKPIMVNGKERNELSCDIEEITPELYGQAESHKMRATAGGGIGAKAAEVDFTLHLYLGFASIVAVNPDISFEDLEQIKGRTLDKIFKVGRSFFIPLEDSTQDNSEKESETIPESIVQAQ